MQVQKGPPEVEVPWGEGGGGVGRGEEERGGGGRRGGTSSGGVDNVCHCRVEEDSPGT